MTNYIEKFKEIARQYCMSIKKKVLGLGLTPEMIQMARRFGLSDERAVAVARLVNRYPKWMSESDLLSTPYKWIKAVNDSDISALNGMKFIEEKTLSNGSKRCRLADEMYRAMREGGSAADCYGMLAGIECDMPMSPEWRDGFYHLIESGGCVQMQNALKELKIRELPDNAQGAFWCLAAWFAKSFSRPVSGETLPDECRTGHGLDVLVKEGLAEMMQNESTDDSKTEFDLYALSVRVVGALFSGHGEIVSYEGLSMVSDVILAGAIVKKDLYYSVECRGELDSLRKMLSADGFARASSILKRQKRKPAIISLLWGPPGTGKTEIVKQLAGETGRDIILFSAAKVTASLWGETEKLYRRLFLEYGYVAAVSASVPILLMNEADQALSRRFTSLDRSIDKAENVVTNILLQAFEDFSGILIATTNLATNLDEAFDRRFLFKTEVPKPDAEARRRIWKSVIPELKDGDAGRLAREFEMTGAQINNVATKRELAELYYEGDRGYSYIRDLCRSECSVCAGESRKKIGY